MSPPDPLLAAIEVLKQLVTLPLLVIALLAVVAVIVTIAALFLIAFGSKAPPELVELSELDALKLSGQISEEEHARRHKEIRDRAFPPPDY